MLARLLSKHRKRGSAAGEGDNTAVFTGNGDHSFTKARSGIGELP
jgi:hypothetical protein